MVNRYDTPAQAEFINTYVPIPFEQLYNLGNQAKQDVDKALKDYMTAANTWSDFQSPSERDTRRWYDLTFGNTMPVVEQMSKNPELIKDPQYRMQLMSAINNVDRASLSMLKQSAAGMQERMKANQQLMKDNKFNETWHNVDFANYDTLGGQGIFNDVSPLGYKSEVDLVKPYLDDLDLSFLGSDGRYLHTGRSQEMVKKQVDANLSAILNTPEARKHIQVLQQQGLSPEDAYNRFMTNVYTAANEFVVDKVQPDPYGMLEARAAVAYRYSNKKKQDKEAIEYPDTYNKVYTETAVNEEKKLLDSPIYNATRSVMGEMARMKYEIETAWLPAYQSGQVTEEQFKRALKDYQDYESQLINSDAYKRAYQTDIRKLFFDTAGEIAPEQGSKADMVKNYNTAASRVLDAITQSTSGDIMSKYNQGQAISEVDINDNGFNVKAYVAPDTKNMLLATDYVNKLMGVSNSKTNTKYMVKDVNGLDRNFGEELKKGVFKNVLIVPSSRVSTGEIDGDNQLVQRVTVKIPVSSLQSAKYDLDSFSSMVRKKFGGTFQKTLSPKIIKSDDVKDAAYDNSIPLTDGYYTFDVMQPMNPVGMSRLDWDQNVNKDHGGSAMQNEQFSGSFNDSFEQTLKALSNF